MRKTDDIQFEASLRVMQMGLIGMIVNKVIDNVEDCELFLELAKEHLLTNFDVIYTNVMENFEEEEDE